MKNKARRSREDEAMERMRSWPRLAREYRIARLVEIVQFAYSDAGPTDLLQRLHKLKRECSDVAFMSDFPGDPEIAFPLVKRTQKLLLDGLNAIVFGRDYDTNCWRLPAISWEVTRIDTDPPTYERHQLDSAELVFLHACTNMICGPEGWRLQPCSEPGCSRFYIQRKKGAYCDQHNTARLRSHRHREAMKQQLTPEERTIRRYCYYLAQLSRKDVKRYNERLRTLKANQPDRYKAVMKQIYGLSTGGKSK